MTGGRGRRRRRWEAEGVRNQRDEPRVTGDWKRRLRSGRLCLLELSLGWSLCFGTRVAVTKDLVGQ